MSSGQKQPKSLRYSDTGVNIDEGEALISDIAPHAKRTKRTGTNTELGGFGGLFDIKSAGFIDPILVAATDGVGTKLDLARRTGWHRSVGIDLVAMCANDILAQGATPLFFLDYFATGKLDRSMALEVIAGIADGCVEANCALIGGETAEMPGMYPIGTYDLAGFCVGAAERGTLLSPERPKAGDIAIGLQSSGIHSNGFSLVRKVIDVSGVEIDAPAPFNANAETLGEALMTPTRIYQKAAAAALAVGGVSGIAHVTGGGLIENPPRVYDSSLTFQLDCATAPLPPVFCWLRDTGNIELFELARTFNCGIGLIIYVEPRKADQVLQALKAGPEPNACIIGKLIERDGREAVILNKSDNWLSKA